MSNNVHTRRYQDPSIICVRVSSISQNNNNNNNNILHATRRDATPSQSHPRAPKTLQAPAHLKNEGANTLMGQYHIRDLTHAHKTPTVTKKSSIQYPESHKAICRRKKAPPRISRGAKGAGKTYSEGMTRARERGRSGRFGGGDREVGSSPAGSCWGGEWGVGLRGIFEGERRGRGRGRGGEEGFVERRRRLGSGASRGGGEVRR